MSMRRAATVILVSALLLAGCAQDEALGAQPVTPVVEITEKRESAARIPPGFTSSSTVQFDGHPQTAGDLSVGLLLPTADRSGLNIFGVGADGTRLQLLTNPSCVGFVSTRDAMGPLLVVLDSDAAVDDGRLATTTVATAFRVGDGSVVWGPVPVPGPTVSGSGLIFADTPKSVVSGAAASRVMLSAADGSVANDRFNSSTVFVHEHQGLGLISADGSLRAIDTATGGIRWSEDGLTRPEGVPPDASATFTQIVGTDRGSIIPLTWETADADKIVAAYDFSTGQYLGSLPPGTQKTSTTAPDKSATAFLTERQGKATVTAISANGGVLWETEMAGDVTLGAASNAVVYATSAGDGYALSWLDGEVVTRGDFAVPSIVDSAGTAYVPTGSPFEYALAVPRTF